MRRALVPGYLAYLAGLVGVEAPLESGRHRWRVAGAAALFVAGFTVVFGAILVGVVWLADALVDNQAVLQRVGGVVPDRQQRFSGWWEDLAQSPAGSDQAEIATYTVEKGKPLITLFK